MSKIKGINYNVGYDVDYNPNEIVESLTLEQIRAHIEMIKKDLGCNAVKILGKDIEKVFTVSELALQQNLQVWITKGVPIPKIAHDVIIIVNKVCLVLSSGSKKRISKQIPNNIHSTISATIILINFLIKSVIGVKYLTNLYT